MPATAPAVPDAWDPWEWAVVCHLARYGPKTRQNHRAGLRRWMAWCAERHVDPMTAAEVHVNTWARHLDEEAGLGAWTIGGYLTALAGVYRWAHRNDLRSDDPTRYVRRPRTPRTSPTASITRDEARRVLDTSWSAPPPITAAVHLWALNGTRWGETLAIDIDHIGRHGDTPTIHLPKRKGGTPGDVALSAPTWAAVQRAMGDRIDGPLLLGLRRGRIDHHALRRGFRAVLDRAGIERRITPHGLRHSFVTLALDAGVSERDIMASTGHTDPSMIGYYDRARASIERNCTHAVTAWVLGDTDP